ncbi:MAG TPA: serine/threonine-protein kinase [Polyangiaceae bacterium]|jgi:serine/threonine-protein kinase
MDGDAPGNVDADSASAADPRQPIGQCVADKYALTRIIGTGSMGSVYEGVHVDLGKRLAIKLIRPEFCDSAEIVGRFRREARAASAASSEHIVQIFDFGRDEALGFYMVSEYLIGEDLEKRLEREPGVPVPVAADIAWQVARGLARAHAVGVVHRDLKPANIFLTHRDDGSLLAKILDFGISKIDERRSERDGDARPEPTLTKRGTTLGTPQYMSPEQCTGKARLDARTDVWSLCAVLYEMLAGQPAVSDAGGFIAAMQRIVSGDVVQLVKRAPWVSKELAAVVDRGLVRDRDRRTRDAETLAAELLAAAQAPAPRTQVPSEPPPSSAEDAMEVFVRSGEVPVPLGRRRA